MRLDTLICNECGARVAENWLARHQQADCEVGTRGLSPMQRAVLRRIAMGSERAVALDLGLSYATTRYYLRTLYEHFDVVGQGRVNLLLAALQSGEVALEELVAPAHILGGLHDSDTN